LIRCLVSSESLSFSCSYHYYNLYLIPVISYSLLLIVKLKSFSISFCTLFLSNSDRFKFMISDSLAFFLSLSYFRSCSRRSFLFLSCPTSELSVSFYRRISAILCLTSVISSSWFFFCWTRSSFLFYSYCFWSVKISHLTLKSC
jgi:hypothetical protein